MTKLLSVKDLHGLGITFSRSQRWRLEREQKFPRRILVSPRRSAWDADEIAAWLEARKAERGAA